MVSEFNADTGPTKPLGGYKSRATAGKRIEYDAARWRRKQLEQVVHECYGFDRWMIVVSALLTLARFSAVEEPARAALVFMAVCDVCLLGTLRWALEVAVVARLGTALGVAALLVQHDGGLFIEKHVRRPSAFGGLNGGCALLGGRLFDS